MRTCLFAGLLPLAVTAASSSVAAQNLIVNGSFEQATGIGANATLSPGATSLDGWTVVGGGNLIWCDSSSYCAAPASDGQYSLDLTGLTNAVPYAGVEQTVATTAGHLYAVSFDVGGRSDSFPAAVYVYSLDASFGDVYGSGDQGAWRTGAFTFIANGSATTIGFLGNFSGGAGLSIQLDNVHLEDVTPVPEAPVWALLSAGLLVGAAWRVRPRCATTG